MSLVKSVTLTPAKLAANRANARRSTGPRTPQGQQRTRLNALKHGLCSRSFARTVVNSAEGQKKFQRGMVMLRLALVPAGSAARKLTEKLARMMWTRSRGGGPNGRQPFFLCSRRELALLANVSQICEWWYGDKAPLAIHAAFAGDATNPQCPLESTDRNFDASLFPFHWLRSASPSELRRMGKAMAARVLRFADQLLLYAMYQRGTQGRPARAPEVKVTDDQSGANRGSGSGGFTPPRGEVNSPLQCQTAPRPQSGSALHKRGRRA